MDHTSPKAESRPVRSSLAVFRGRVIYTFADREEVHEAGDAFYVEGGHLQRADAGTEYLQFSPADELRITVTAVTPTPR